MIVMVLIGAAIGAVLFGVVLLLAPPKDSPLVQLGKLDAILTGQAPVQPAAQLQRSGLGLDSVRARIGTVAAALVTRRGVDYTSLRQDLALSGKNFEATMGRKVLLFVGGFLGALALMTLFVSTGVARLPPGLPIVAGLGFGLVLFFMPDIDARAAANRRRKDFRHALSQYLDLVVLDMAGSAAPAEALPKVAAVLQGWPVALIQDTLYRATRAGTDPWDALTNLGTRIGVSELRDLGQLVKLVAHDGAKIRQTLSARATTMRRRELADSQGVAGERDQSMRLAQMVLAMGFVLFLGYPAIVAILSI